MNPNVPRPPGQGPPQQGSTGTIPPGQQGPQRARDPNMPPPNPPQPPGQTFNINTNTFIDD